MEQLVHENDNSHSLIGYYPNVISPNLLQRIREYCVTTPNYQGGITNFGTQVPRLQKWYQEDEGYFSNRWHKKHSRWEAFPYDHELQVIQHQIQALTEQTLGKYHQFQPHVFNSCLLNYYRDHQDSIRAHSDDEPTFGRHPTVAVISVGATRTIQFTRKVPGTGIKPDPTQRDLSVTIPLTEGSLLLMAGSTQDYYIHEIPKQANTCGSRHSLTFRQYYPQS
jgi:alkylated DNA repair dioxygenase AlkB